MMKPPKFSIVIPTYNRAKLIMPTLESVFAQSYTNFEVLVVDNCSTDNTEEVLQPLIDSGKINFIKHDKNYERAKSRNTGMSQATGDFLTFLDSDDFLYANCLNRAAEFIQKHPENRIFHTLYELVNERKERIKSYSFKPIKNAQKQIMEGNFLSCIGVFIHREVYSSIAFDLQAELIGSEDHDYWIRVLAEFPNLGRINSVQTGILEHDQRTVNQIDVDKALDRKLLMADRIENDENLFRVYKPYLKAFKAYSYVFASSNYMALGQLKKSMHYLKQALRIDVNSALTPFFIKVLLLNVLKTLKLK